MAPDPQVFELRTYHAAPGRIDALLDRFRHHTLGLFDRHGLRVVGFWRVADAAGAATDTLVYVLAFADRERAATAWAAFQADPDWIEAKRRSEVDGPLTTSIESVTMAATDFSPLR